MDAVPILFYEEVIDKLHTTGPLRCCKLDGWFGVLSSRAYENYVHRHIIINGGQIKKEVLLSAYGHRDTVEPNHQQKVRRLTSISICAGPNECKLDQDVIDRVLTATNGNFVQLYMFTSNNMLHLIESVQKLYLLQLWCIDEHSLKNVEVVVRKKTLIFLHLLHFDEPYDTRFTPVLMELFKQDQFQTLSVTYNCVSLVEELIGYWFQNTEKMRGKYIRCQEPAQCLRSSNFGFRKCTDAEHRDRCSRVPIGQELVGDWSRSRVESYIFRNDTGAAMYWMFSAGNKKLGIFDDSLVLFD